MLFALLSHPFLLLFSAIAGFLMWQYVLRMYWFRRMMPPGPFPIPFVGNLLYFKGSKHTLPKTVTHFSKIYGNPTTIWLATQPSIFLNNYNDVREVLIDNMHDFQDRPQTLTGDIFQRNSQDIIFANYNKMWAFHKKIAARAMRRVVESSHLEYHANEAIDDIVGRILCEEGSVPIRQYTNTIVNAVINTFCFGKSASVDHPFFVERMKMMDEFNEVSNNMNLLEGIWGIRYLRSIVVKTIPMAKKLQAFMDCLMNYVDTEVAEHNKGFDPESAKLEVKDILEALMYEQHLAVKEGNMETMLNNGHIGLIIMDIFAEKAAFSAGVETTAVTLQWLFLRLIVHPELQEACYQQINLVCGDRSPAISDRSNLPLIEACVMETLRYHPIAPIGVPTTACKDAKFREFTIPKNTIIFTNLMALHFDETVWKNPQEFNPHRFIADDGVVVKHQEWLPFGVGKRVCLGETLAKNELFLVAAGLIQKLKFKRTPGEKYSLEPLASNDFNMQPSNPQFSATVEART